MKILYCAYKRHYKNNESYYSNGSFPDLLPELSKYFKKLYLMVPVSTHYPKNMSKLDETKQLEIVETKLYSNKYYSYIGYYFWSFFNIILFRKYQHCADAIVIAIPSSLPYLVYIPFIKKPLITLIAGDEQEFLKSSNSFASKIGFFLRLHLFKRLVEKILINKSESVICRSELFKRKLISNYGVPKEKINVITSGVRTNLFKPYDPEEKAEMKKKMGLKKDSFVIGFIAAHLSYAKGIDTLLKSFQLLKKYNNVELLLVGDNAIDLQESDSIHLCGTIKKNELPNYYNAMDALVFPSRSEGAPKVVMEASSCGIPVISTRIGGIPEIIIEEETGFLVDVDDAKNIQRYCELLINNQTMRYNMGINARNHALCNFNFEMLTERIYNVIKNTEKTIE